MDSPRSNKRLKSEHEGSEDASRDPSSVLPHVQPAGKIYRKKSDLSPQQIKLCENVFRDAIKTAKDASISDEQLNQFWVATFHSWGSNRTPNKPTFTPTPLSESMIEVGSLKRDIHPMLSICPSHLQVGNHMRTGGNNKCYTCL